MIDVRVLQGIGDEYGGDGTPQERAVRSMSESDERGLGEWLPPRDTTTVEFFGVHREAIPVRFLTQPAVTRRQRFRWWFAGGLRSLASWVDGGL